MSRDRGESVGNLPEAEWTEDLARLADVIVAMASLRFDEIPEVPGQGPVAAIAAGLSALSEELQATVVARAEAETANRAKSDFMANMSHELRTPLTTILGTASLLEHTNLDGRQTRYVSRILAASQALERLVGDVLDFARLEAGRLRLVEETHDLSQVLDTALEAHRDRAARQGLALRQHPWEVPEALVQCDGPRVAQILHNLIENALKYTPSGTVRVGVTHRETPDGLDLAIEVEDTGVGIPADQLDGVFERFTQLDSSLKRAHAGAGLGLSIAHALAERMDGGLSVRSVLGEGSTFCLTLPLKSAPVPAEGPATDVQVERRGPRVLVVDDSREIREMISAMLSLQDLEHVLVHSGEAALAALSQGGFDLVLMDVQMPGLDGLETTRRALARWPSLHVVAVTAHSRSKDLRACAAAGMRDHLAKPFDIGGFFEMIQANLAAGR